MFIVHLVVSVLTAGALIFSATATLLRHPQVLINMAKAGVPESWLPKLGVLKAAGAVGLLVGLGIPWIGVVAAVGVTLFFVGAIITHVRARWYSFTFPSVFLVLAVGSLASRLASN